jgi:D-glycero-alpha-D-manno-heptose 1-phosphate guanylyltransferase
MATITLTGNCDVLLLCGGLGKRLRPLLRDKPKPMIEICGKPFLDILIDYTAGFGFRRFILCTGYKSALIKKHYEAMKGSLDIVISHESRPRGTAGAVKNAEPFIHSSPFLVLNADSFCPINFMDFLKFHREKKAMASVALTKKTGAGDYGSIVIDRKGKITGFHEKRAGAGERLVSAGIYLFDKKILERMPANRKYSMEYDLFPALSGKDLYGYVIQKDFIDIGTPERYVKARRMLGNMVCG